MPALVESMFYVSNEQNDRFVPWHGLGTAVENAPSSIEAIKLAGLDWDVIAEPIFDARGKEILGKVATTRSSDFQNLGIVSSKYQIVQNRDAFAFTDEMLGQGVTYETAGSLKNGKTIWLLAKMPRTTVLGEDVDPYMVFCNTHDGSGAVRVALTPIRVVCNNTLNFALASASRSWSTRHIGDMASKKIEAMNALGLADEYIKALDNAADELACIKFDENLLIPMINDICGFDPATDSDRKKENAKQIYSNLMRCWKMPDVDNFRNTAYGALLAVTDMVDHYAPNRYTQTYQENNWGKIINGHQIVDKAYNFIQNL